MSDQDRDWDRAQASDSQSLIKAPKTDTAGTGMLHRSGYLEKTLSQFSLTVSLSQYRQYRLGSLTRDTIPLTADIVTLSHYLGTLPPRRLEVGGKK